MYDKTTPHLRGECGTMGGVECWNPKKLQHCEKGCNEWGMGIQTG
jgi:hypothetical protein